MKSTPFRERQLQDLMRIVCNVGGVQPRSLIYGGKADSLVFARLLFYYAARSYLGASFPTIATVANRDHTTIMSGVRTVQGRIDTGHRPTLTALGQVREKLGIGMARETKTIITCARCKTTESEGKAKGIDAYVIREVDGRPKLETLRGRRHIIMHDLKVRAEDITHESVLREHVATDLCDGCVTIINEALNFNIVDQDRRDAST